MFGNLNSIFKVMALAAAIAFTGTASAQPIDFDNPAFARTTGATSIPIGHLDFCRRYRDECTRNARVAEATILTQEKWEQLIAINNRMNTEIIAVTDDELYNVAELWDYPVGYGDCEDFALAKRRLLIENGWNPSTLMIAVVRQLNGEGHAVLMVRTDRGDLVLDNLVGSIDRWNDTPYQYIKRQSQADAGEWESINDTRDVAIVASTR